MHQLLKVIIMMEAKNTTKKHSRLIQVHTVTLEEFKKKFPDDMETYHISPKPIGFIPKVVSMRKVNL